MNILRILLPLVAIVVSSCFKNETDYEKQVKAADQAILAYLNQNDIDAERSHSGMYFEVIDANFAGEVIMENSVVSIIYTMRLLSGALIEQYDDISNPIKFSYSANSLAPTGLNYEIGRMRFGDTYRFYVPSYLAYENYKHEGLFDSYSNFIVDVTVVDILSEEFNFENETYDIENYLYDNGITTATKYPSGLFYLPIVEGTGTNPGTYSQVKIHYTRKYLDGTLIKSTLSGQPLIVPLGQGNLIPGLEEGIKLMKKGGTATIIVPSILGFGKSFQVIPQSMREDWVDEKKISPEVKPFSPLVHEVELIDFTSL